MVTRNELTAAVDANILSAAQADALLSFLNERDPFGTGGDAEDVHFARGMHDILMALGLAVLLPGIWFLDPGTGGLLGLLACWGLAEYFTARKRLVLPSLVLAGAFTLFSSFFGGALILAFTQEAVDLDAVGDGAQALSFGIAAALAAGLFYLRFKLPFALGLTAAGGALVVLGIAEIAMPGLVSENSETFTLLLGALFFAAALYEDARDPERLTLHSDNAFWLHLLAAPALVHGIIGQQLPSIKMEGMAEPLLVLATMTVLTLVALIIDRRALLVSGLGYLVAALGTLVQMAFTSGDDTMGFTLTLVVVGATILIIGTAWSRLRQVIVPRLPQGIQSKVRPALTA